MRTGYTDNGVASVSETQIPAVTSSEVYATDPKVCDKPLLHVCIQTSAGSLLACSPSRTRLGSRKPLAPQLLLRRLLRQLQTVQAGGTWTRREPVDVLQVWDLVVVGAGIAGSALAFSQGKVGQLSVKWLSGSNTEGRPA